MEILTTGVVELVVAFLTGVVGPVAYYLINNHIEHKREKKDEMVSSVKENSTIQSELQSIKDIIDVDRVWIAQFHNGGVFYPTGRSIQKFSIFYEISGAGISNIAHEMNNIPCSLYSIALTRLLKDEKILIPEFNDHETYGLKNMTEITGSESMYILPLFSIDDKFIGMIGIDFVKEPQLLTSKELEEYKLHAAKIAGYLSNFLYNTNE